MVRQQSQRLRRELNNHEKAPSDVDANPHHEMGAPNLRSRIAMSRQVSKTRRLCGSSALSSAPNAVPGKSAPWAAAGNAAVYRRSVARRLESRVCHKPSAQRRCDGHRPCQTPLSPPAVVRARPNQSLKSPTHYGKPPGRRGRVCLSSASPARRLAAAVGLAPTLCRTKYPSRWQFRVPGGSLGALNPSLGF